MTLLKGNFRGLQHLGVPITDMERSKSFYLKLGFEPVMEAAFDSNGDKGLCCMMKRENVVIELYQMPAAELAKIRARDNGHIDHIAFDVKDIDQAYAELKKAGLTIEEDAPVFLDFWKHGCRYFNVIGPDGERLEFAHIISSDENESR